MTNKTDKQNNGCNSCSHHALRGELDWDACVYTTILEERDPITGEFLTRGYTCKEQNKNLDCQFYEPSRTYYPSSPNEFIYPPALPMILVAFIIMIIILYGIIMSMS